jgi:S1-C subfamily serine protease
MKNAKYLVVLFVLQMLMVGYTVTGLRDTGKAVNDMQTKQRVARITQFRQTDERDLLAAQVRFNNYQTVCLGQQPNYAGLQANSVRVDLGGGCGTGVLVTRKVSNVTRTYVWTAGHCAAVLRQPDGSFRNATVYQERRKDGVLIDTVKTEAKVIAYSEANFDEDLALLEILKDNFPADGAKFLLDETPVVVGTKLVHVGCTLGLYNSVSQGVMSQTDRDILQTGKVFDQTSCMGFPGSSGGGVYLEDGRCIGLLVRGAAPGLNFIVPMRRILPWAKKMGVEWAVDPSVPVPLVRAENKLEIVRPVIIELDPPEEEPALAPKQLPIIPLR